MSVKPFAELVKRTSLINQQTDTFSIFVDSADTFLSNILENVAGGISQESEPRNSDGEYVFTDGTDGNEIVIGIKDYMTREKLSQYNSIFGLSDAMYGNKIQEVGSDLVNTIKTIFLPWVLVDVLIGIPTTVDIADYVDTNLQFGKLLTLPNTITYDHVNVFREYVAGTVDINMVKKTVDEIHQLENGENFAVRTIFNILFREKLLVELVNVIGRLKTTHNPDITPLYESYVTTQRNKYMTAYNTLMRTSYPDKEVGIQTNTSNSNIIQHRYYEHNPITPNTQFAVDTETRDERHGNTGSVKCLRTTNARYQYSNDAVGHVLVQTIQFGRWWAGMTAETVIVVIGLISGIVADLETVDCAGFIPIGVPPEGADIARDIARDIAMVNMENQKNDMPLPKNVPLPPKKSPIEMLKRYSDYSIRNMQDPSQYGYLKFLHTLINTYEVVMIEKHIENNGANIQIDIENKFKNVIRRTLDDADVTMHDAIVSGLKLFATQCMVDGVWSVSKLNDFVMNSKSIDMVLHGEVDNGGVSVLFGDINTIGMGIEFTSSPDITKVTMNGEPIDGMDISTPDVRQNVRITNVNGIRYIPLIVKINNTSVFTRLFASIAEILGDEYVSRGSLFIDLVGQIVVMASKPPRILGTTIGHGVEVAARTASVVMPPIALTTNLVAMPAKYIFNVAVYNEMSQYALFGLGQIIGRPILNGIQSIALVVQIVSLIGMGVVSPRIIRYVDVPLRQIWSVFVESLSKKTLSREDDLVGVDYPTRFTYIKRFDRVDRYGDNTILDRSDAELVSRLVLNEYLYDIVWKNMRDEWYSYNDKITDRLRDFIDTQGVSEDIKSLFDDFYFSTLDAGENNIVGNSVRIMLSNIFEDANRYMLFPDYMNFIRVCKSRTKTTIDRETGDPKSYQTCTRISCEKADLEVYERAFNETFPDLDLDEIGLMAMVNAINDRLGGDINTGNATLDNVISDFPFEFTDVSTDSSFQKSVIGLFDETIDEVRGLGERMLRNIMNG